MSIEKDKPLIKKVTKAKTDVGAIKRSKNEDADKQSKATGSTFDVKHFRGNSHIFQHMTEFQLSMLNDQPPLSNSIDFRRKKNQGYGEDFGMK